MNVVDALLPEAYAACQLDGREAATLAGFLAQVPESEQERMAGVAKSDPDLIRAIVRNIQEKQLAVRLQDGHALAAIGQKEETTLEQVT